ncbi:Adipocyte plasma membrane-associated protein [Amphibalanus amphitrite]|uniref:Adipocyte plasma membrane-associated protein n=2 Tax=Amphibalanus amphitrite TaxID=1232801 RepID=A0A6A4VGM9_AMPAM|nr:Adipocyte plasma membrane-associated protein [Amphibalanus amphitrite]KAF0290715.1 Adipocyte plasma membrane-associated protein [Amphibalanus amphitrite]
MGLLKWIGRMLLDFTVITIAIMLFPGISPNAEFEVTRFSDSPPLEGVLERNERLSSMEPLLGDLATGPESTASRGGAVYTGVEGGAILRLTDDGGAETVAQLGRCDDPLDSPRCGRPLGIRFDQQGRLLVADAYLGIHRVNVSSGAVERLVPTGVMVDGEPLRFCNDVLSASDGTIYFTSSSAIADLHNGFMELAVRGTGRLFRHDPVTNTTTVLLSGINFANGIALNGRETALLVSETARYRVLRVWLKGGRAGTSEVAADNLPGFPDNIRPRPDGGFFVGLCGLRYQNPLAEGLIKPHPLLAKLLLRILSVAMTPIRLLERAFPNPYTQTIIYKGVTMRTMQRLSSYGRALHAMGLELSDTGAVTGSLHTSRMACISEVNEHDGALFLGSPFEDFLGRVPAAPRTIRVRTKHTDGSMSVSVGDQ